MKHAAPTMATAALVGYLSEFETYSWFKYIKYLQTNCFHVFPTTHFKNQRTYQGLSARWAFCRLTSTSDNQPTMTFNSGLPPPINIKSLYIISTTLSETLGAIWWELACQTWIITVPKFCFHKSDWAMQPLHNPISCVKCEQCVSAIIVGQLLVFAADMDFLLQAWLVFLQLITVSSIDIPPQP